MRTYIIRRLLLMIPTMIVVSIVAFFTIRFIPGNVVEINIFRSVQTLLFVPVLLLVLPSHLL